jgi:hypothetical protein
MQSMKIPKSNTPRWTHILVVLLTLLIILFYVWLISVGLWTRWPATTNYYDQLASAFQHGQLHLEQQPDPRLFQLANPYDPEARSGIPTPLDISLYNGKFYLYWGPAPGLLLSIFKPVFTDEIGDQYLVFVILSGIFILEILIILKLQRLFFPDIPVWAILASILLAGLATPYAWMFNNPRVYDVAIGSGQFFFLAGFYTIINVMARSAAQSEAQRSRSASDEAISPSLSKKQKHNYVTVLLKLVFVGIFWSFVLGSRLTQAMLIAFISVVTVIWFFKHNEYSIKSTLPYALALGLPLTLGLILLGWYNYARFGSVFETGFSYALAGPYLQQYKGQFFLPAYIPQNLYNYIINPIGFRERYPFFKSVLGKTLPIFSFYTLPNAYTSDEITGWIYSAPFTFFATIPIVTLILNLKKRMDDNQRFLNWTIVSLFGAFIFAFAPLLVFFWLSTRYMMDFFPELVLLSIIGFWEGYQLLKQRPVPHIVYSFIGIALALITVIISNALGLSSHTARIRAYNPELWNFLINFFDR